MVKNCSSIFKNIKIKTYKGKIGTNNNESITFNRYNHDSGLFHYSRWFWNMGIRHQYTFF